jgi:hypothetical protein
MQKKRLGYSSSACGKYEVITAIPLGMSYAVFRYETSGEERDRGEMFLEALAYFESHYHLQGKNLLHHVIDGNMVYALMLLETTKMESMYRINAPFSFNRFPVSRTIFTPPPAVFDAFKLADSEYFSSILNTTVPITHLVNDVFKESNAKIEGKPASDGISWYGCDYEVPSLETLCMRSVSWYNRVFTGDALGPYSMNTSANLFPTKLVNLISALDTPTTKLKLPRTLAGCVSRAFNHMYDKMGMRKHFGQLVFVFRPEDITHMAVSGAASSGIRPGRVRKEKVNDYYTNVFTPYGTKLDQRDSCARKYLAAYQTWLDGGRRPGTFRITERCYTTVPKDEIINCVSIDPSVRAAKNQKCRIYYIQPEESYMAAVVAHGHRKVERGKYIKIGQRWWHGGALAFAVENNYLDADMTIDEGDLRAQDQHLVLPLIELFSYSSLLYFNKDLGDYDFLVENVREAAKNLGVKQLHLMGQIFCLLVGKIPSGAFETSMCDSWYLVLLFFIFLEWACAFRPDRADQIRAEDHANRIHFPTFGDDHGIHRRRVIDDVINETCFNEFCKKYFNIDIKPESIRQGLKYLSVPDNFGGLSYTGFSFCKKYSILRPDFMPKYCAAVVPYRRFEDVAHKLGYGSRDRYTNADYIMSLISAAYDSYGTNLRLYNFISTAYHHLIFSGGYTSIEEVVQEYISNADRQFDITKVIRKIGVSQEKLFLGFPTLEVLWEMHVYDPEYVNFTPEFRTYNYTMNHEYDPDDYYL